MNGSSHLIEKRRKVISVLRGHRAVLVALSGGVDSATLLALASEAVGPEHVLAVTGRSGSVTEGEVEDAARVARSMGVRHEIVETREIDRPAYRANTGSRCFHCRTELFEVLATLAQERGIDAIAYGAIVDDVGDDRPGMVAAREMGILAPLLEAGICKNEVRTLAKELSLHVYEKPSNACLASRIPVGHEVTAERLRQVGDAEAALRELGFRQFRVRHHDDVARLELGDGEAERLADPGTRDATLRAVKGAGFRFVAVDLEPYRSGRLNTAAADRLHSIGPARDNGQ